MKALIRLFLFIILSPVILLLAPIMGIIMDLYRILDDQEWLTWLDGRKTSKMIQYPETIINWIMTQDI